MALEMWPPFLLVTVRFLISGSILLSAGLVRGAYLPRGRELAASCLAGILTLGIGNTALVYAETLIPSGLAGLIVTISPFWMVGVEALLPGGERLHWPTIGGMVVGLLGAALLLVPKEGWGSVDRNLLTGLLVLQVGMAAWSFGSIIQRRKSGRAHPIIAGGVQQLAAGVTIAPFAFGLHEHPLVWSSRGVLALAYLVTFGSIVGYSAFVYAMDKLPVAVVSIYPYANVVVALALGWLFYREPFGGREAAAMATIFVGVGIVKRSSPAREH
jgi:drug/metabolite transporter (DMT)-like permease